MNPTTTLAVIPTRSSDLAARTSIVETFLSGRSPRTLEAYRQDLGDFARFLGAASAEEASRLFMAGGKGKANETAHAYRASLLDRGLAPATVNRRLAAVRSLVKVARLFGLVDFVVEVQSVKSQAYRDTKGPGRIGVRRLLDELETRTGEKATRDRALVRLLYDLGLRRGEAVALDLEDVDLQAGAVSIIGKGRTERETLTLPEQTKAALGAWIAVRGALGDSVGLVVRPHGLRHAAVTEALDATNGNVRAVQKFSRHRDLRVLTRYDDNRVDLGGEVARLVAARV